MFSLIMAQCNVIHKREEFKPITKDLNKIVQFGSNLLGNPCNKHVNNSQIIKLQASLCSKK
jgi:hypothetical protein